VRAGEALEAFDLELGDPAARRRCWVVADVHHGSRAQLLGSRLDVRGTSRARLAGELFGAFASRAKDVDSADFLGCGPY